MRCGGGGEAGEFDDSVKVLGWLFNLGKGRSLIPMVIGTVLIGAVFGVGGVEGGCKTGEKPPRDAAARFGGWGDVFQGRNGALMDAGRI